MPLRSDWSDANCPIERGLNVLGDPWSLLILREVFSGAHRFDSLRNKVGAADNILSDRLRRLVEAGLLERRPYSTGARPRSEYWLTEAGEDTLPILHAIGGWGEKHTVSPSGRAMRIICRTCGSDTATVDRCMHCGGPLTRDTVSWVRPSAPDRIVELASAQSTPSDPASEDMTTSFES